VIVQCIHSTHRWATIRERGPGLPYRQFENELDSESEESTVRFQPNPWDARLRLTPGSGRGL
jgi:hypothetical protein